MSQLTTWTDATQPEVNTRKGGRVRALKIGALCAAFLAAIVIANLTLTKWGPVMILPNAFVLIGLDLATRDRLADLWGTRRVGKMALLIALGGLLSWYVNRSALTIAEASAISFAAAEIVNAVAYHLQRHRPWTERAPRAAVFGAAVDSIVFPTLAFGVFSFTTSFGQFCAKLAGALVWAWLIGSLMPPPVVAPEAV